jgi:hypothetical protein
MATTTGYQKVADAARWYLRQEQLHHNMHYAEIRPMHFPRPPHYPTHMDCSWFATLCFHTAYLADPNGNHYDGSGNTTTLRAHGRSVSVQEVREGDLVFYGTWGISSDPSHVVVAVSATLCVSMGQEGDPALLPIGYRPVVEARRYPGEGGPAHVPPPTEPDYRWDREVTLTAARLSGSERSARGALTALRALMR